jgi:hypothetical protein
VQSINANPTTFRNETGGWKIKIKGVKENIDQFSLLCDWVEFKPTYSYYTTDWYGDYTIEGFALMDEFNIAYWAYFNASTVYQTMFIYNFNTSVYDQIGDTQLYSTAGVGQWQNGTVNSDLSNYVSSSNLRIRIVAEQTFSIPFNCYADFQNVGVSGTGGGTTSTQKLYVMDYSNSQWHLLATSSIANTDQQEGPVEVSGNINNYVDAQGTVLVRVYSESETMMNCEANFMMIRLYSFSPSKISLEVMNIGSETVSLERIWVDNSTGHSKIDLSAGTNIDRKSINPGEQALIQVDYLYSTCQYTFKVTTKRGTIAAYVKTAS